MVIDKLKTWYRFVSPRFQTVFLDYKVNPTPRQGHGKPTHPKLYEIINKERDTYLNLLQEFMLHESTFLQIKKQVEESNENEPAWNNNFLPGLDIVSLYGMIAHFKPKKYIEVGSGNSTKVVRKAIKDLGLGTQITSIDPYPRAQIDHLADVVIRKPFEDLEDNMFIIESLEAGDILFIDNSHRVFANSDATIFFLEILPYLKKGVIVHIHDIYLPDDYPDFMADRFYNEQYVLAAFVLANPTKYKTIFPCWFVSQDKDLMTVTQNFFEHPNLKDVETHGGSYWIEIAE